MDLDREHQIVAVEEVELPCRELLQVVPVAGAPGGKCPKTTTDRHNIQALAHSPRLKVSTFLSFPALHVESSLCATRAFIMSTMTTEPAQSLLLALPQASVFCGGTLESFDGFKNTGKRSDREAAPPHRPRQCPVGLSTGTFFSLLLSFSSGLGGLGIAGVAGLGAMFLANFPVRALGLDLHLGTVVPLFWTLDLGSEMVLASWNNQEGRIPRRSADHRLPSLDCKRL